MNKFSEFGVVKYLYVDIDDDYGTIYLEMSSEKEARRIVNLLTNCLFNGRMMIPSYLEEADFLKLTNNREKRNTCDENKEL